MTNREWKKTFGEKLYSLRKEKGLTQNGLAKMLGISQSQLSKIENGVLELSLYAYLNAPKVFRILCQ